MHRLEDYRGARIINPPTPTEEADGNGYGVITGRSDPPGPPSRVSVNQVPLLLTGVRLHPPGRTDKNLCRCFGAPATHVRRPHGRVFPDHLITGLTLNKHTYASVSRNTYARAHYRTSYMGTDGRWNDANSPIDPWQHRHEGGAERGDRKDHLPA